MFRFLGHGEDLGICLDWARKGCLGVLFDGGKEYAIFFLFEERIIRPPPKKWIVIIHNFKITLTCFWGALGRVAKDLVLDWLMLTLHHFVQKICKRSNNLCSGEIFELFGLAVGLGHSMVLIPFQRYRAKSFPIQRRSEDERSRSAFSEAHGTFWFEMHAKTAFKCRGSPGVQRSFPLRRAGTSLRFLFQSRTIDVRGISTPSPASSLWQLLHPLSAHRNGPVAHLEQDERNLRFHEEQRQDGHWSPFMENYSKMLELWPSLKTNRKTYVKTSDMMGLQTFGSLDHVWEDYVGHPSWKEPLLSWRRLGKLKGV